MKKFSVIIFAIVLALFFAVSAIAHPGGTDGAGGHYNHDTGEYHYHHGYPAHQHPNGVCPYSFEDNTHNGGGDSGAISPLPGTSTSPTVSQADDVNDRGGWFSNLPALIQIPLALCILFSHILIPLLFEQIYERIESKVRTITSNPRRAVLKLTKLLTKATTKNLTKYSDCISRMRHLGEEPQTVLVKANKALNDAVYQSVMLSISGDTKNIAALVRQPDIHPLPFEDTKEGIPGWALFSALFYDATGRKAEADDCRKILRLQNVAVGSYLKSLYPALYPLWETMNTGAIPQEMNYETISLSPADELPKPTESFFGALDETPAQDAPTAPPSAPACPPSASRPTHVCLSVPGEVPKTYGTYHVHGEDIALVREDAAAPPSASIDLTLSADETEEQEKPPLPEKDRGSLELLLENIKALQQIYDDAVRNLGDLTIDDAHQAFSLGRITKEQYEELVTAISSLQQIIAMHPVMIADSIAEYNRKLLSLSLEYDTSEFTLIGASQTEPR